MEVLVKEEPREDQPAPEDHDSLVSHGHVAEADYSSGAKCAVVKLEALDVKEEAPDSTEALDTNNTLDINQENIKKEFVQVKKEALEEEQISDTLEDSVDVKQEASLLKELYAGHEVKDELVLGPVGVQQRNETEFVHEEPNQFVREQSIAKEYKYVCGICNKEYRRRPFLLLHIKLHLKHKSIKAYSCSVCKMEFSRLSSLKTHTLVHTGLRQYSCETCRKQFARKGYLKQHKLTHTGDKPYACNVCTKRFRQASYLTVHTRIHTGEKPYSCKVCAKRFHDSSKLAAHNRRISGRCTPGRSLAPAPRARDTSSENVTVIHGEQ